MGKIILSVTSVIVYMLLSGCQENIFNETVVPRRIEQKILIPTLIPSEIIEATLENEMGLLEQEPGYLNLSIIVNKLELSDGQWEDLQLFVGEHNRFTDVKLNYIKSVEAGVISKANNKRLLIINDLNNSHITSGEAKNRLKSVNDDIREYFKNSSVYNFTEREILISRKVMLNLVMSILDSVQYAEWNHYVLDNYYIFYGEPL
jgi:hypothetical protein